MLALSPQTINPPPPQDKTWYLNQVRYHVDQHGSLITVCLHVCACTGKCKCIPHFQLQTIQEADHDSENESQDSEDGGSESDEDVPLRSTNPMLNIYVDDTSMEVATQTDPSELHIGSSCKCDLVLQRLDKVLEAVELMSSEMGVTTLDVQDIKQRCKAMENQLFSMVCTCVYIHVHVHIHVDV